MWNRRDMVVLAAAAAATFGLSLAAFWPQIATAVDDQNVATADVKAPTLNVGSARVTAALDAAHARTVVLTVRNTADEMTTARFSAQANVVGPSSMMSRVAQPFTVVWSQEYAVDLQPGETKAIAVELPAEAFGADTAADGARQVPTNLVPGGGYLILISTDAKQPMAIRALTLTDAAADRRVASALSAP